MPMSPNANRGSYRVVEGRIARQLAARGTLQMYVRGQYRRGATRPSAMWVYITGARGFRCLWVVQN